MLTIGQPARLISCLPRGLEMKFDEFKRCLKWIHAEGGMDDVSKILASVEALFLFRHWTLEKLSTFNLLKLKYCLLAECNEMETLVDASGPSEYVETRTRDGEKAGLELLQYLSIHHMNKLQSIWKGAIGKDSLSKLKILALHTCPQLTSIFSPRFAQNLVCLTELIVEDCPKVISLISSESHNVKHGPIFPSLERIFLLDLPELVNIFGGLYVLEELNTLLIYNCLNLRLSIMELPHINKIEGENEWWNDLDCDKSPWENIFVPLKEGRDLIEQLYEATDSLNHFHNIRFEENDELKS
ncbi:putative leucine-rich repeat domain superfamily [Helianthus anomalus]